MNIRLARTGDLKAIYDHHVRHFNESGREGDLIFAPSETPLDKSLDDYADPKFESFEKPVDEVGWERIWILVSESESQTNAKQVYGLVGLTHNPRLESSLHRALLSMGIEREQRSKGWGSKLIAAAIDFAKQSGLSWIQLNVFDHNEPAKALYKKFGFVPVGTTPDLFRVHGVQISDTEMLLKLR